MILPTVTLCQAAFGLASLSITLQAAAAIARSRTSISIDEPAEPPVVITPAPAPVMHKRPSLKLSRQELLQHARALGVGNARFRNSASKIRLLEAIRAHNEERRAA